MSPQWFRVVAASDTLARATGTCDVPIPDEALALLAPTPADVRRSLDGYVTAFPATPADGAAEALRGAIQGADLDSSPSRLRLGATDTGGVAEALQRVLGQQRPDAARLGPAASCGHVLRLAKSRAADPDSTVVLLAAALRGWIAPALCRAHAAGAGEETEALCAAARSLFRALHGLGSRHAAALCEDAVRCAQAAPAWGGVTQQAAVDSAGGEGVATARAGAFMAAAWRAAAAEDR